LHRASKDVVFIIASGRLIKILAVLVEDPRKGRGRHALSPSLWWVGITILQSRIGLIL
jgi:hypothetical protein